MKFWYKKVNLRDLIAVTGQVVLSKSDSNRRYSAHFTFKFDGRPRKPIGEPLPCSWKLCVLFHSHPYIWIGITVQKSSNRNQIVRFSVLSKSDSNHRFSAHLTFKFDGRPRKPIGEPLPCSWKLCVLFHSHPYIWIGITVQKSSNRNQIVRFSVRVTLKFGGWFWKIIG